jgi:hypothetical protein
MHAHARLASLAIAWSACTPSAERARTATVPPPAMVSDDPGDSGNRNVQGSLAKTPEDGSAPLAVVASADAGENTSPEPAASASAVEPDPLAPWSPVAHPTGSPPARDRDWNDRGRLTYGKTEPVRGSPSDAHTPDGTYRGYIVSRNCPNYAGYDGVVVSGTGMKSFPRLGMDSSLVGTRPEQELEREFWTFARALRRAAATSSIDDMSTGPACLGHSNGAFELHLNDWRHVDGAILRVGAWLLAHDLYGDVALMVRARWIPLPKPASASPRPGG